MKNGIKETIGKLCVIISAAVVLAACQNTSTTAKPVPRDLDRTDNDDTNRVLVEKQLADTTHTIPDSINHK